MSDEEGEDQSYEYDEEEGEYEYEEAEEEELYSPVQTSNGKEYFDNAFDYCLPHNTGEENISHLKSDEFVAIFSALKYIVKNIHNYKISLDWNFNDAKEFRHPVFTVDSNKSTEIVYIFNLSFFQVGDGVFPEIPPKIVPHFSMPASLYFFTVHFPLLSTKHWNPCQNMAIVLEILCALWDEVLLCSSSVANKAFAEKMYDGAILGGSLSDYPLTPHETNIFLDHPPEEIAIEVLLALWFGNNDCCYDFGELQQLLQTMLSGQQDAASASSLSNVTQILAACPKPTVRKTFAEHAGTGYSHGHSSAAKKPRSERDQDSKPVHLRAFDKIMHKLGSLEASSFSSRDTQRMVQWLFASPLLHLLYYEISQFSSGDALRAQNEVLQYISAIVQLDGLITAAELTLSEEEAQMMRVIVTLMKTNWIDTELLDADASELSTLLPAFEQCIGRWAEIEKEGGKAKTPSASPSSSAAVREKVRFVEGLEASHSFRTALHATGGSTAMSACPKFFLRELRTLQQSLSDDVAVFVSEQHPSLLTVAMFVPNDECPYYGGAYLFDVFIPAQYPQVSPQVKFLTTGRGTVRFNPNLYNCGKVCLSLLGTWSGEPWDPKTSNLTQVLNSILFLIFTKDPYFNEPGYTRNAATNRGSLQYDASTLTNSIKFAMRDHLETNTSISVISQAIRDHFAERWDSLEPGVRALVDKLTAQHVMPNIAAVNADLQFIRKWVDKNKKK